MKKLAIIVCACGLIFAGCKNKEVTEETTEPVAPQEEQMDPEMEKCKAKITEQEARKAECEAKKAEFEAKKAEFEKTWAENWAKFDELSIDEQKALIDNYMMFNCPKRCCKGEGAPKCKHGEGSCQHNPAQCPNHGKPECPHHAK